MEQTNRNDKPVVNPSEKDQAEWQKKQRERRAVKWYVIMVKLAHEKKILSRLESCGVVAYLPIRKELHRWSDRKKWIDKVLTPRMVFVNIAMADKNNVFVDRNVLGYMSAPGIPGPSAISDQQMAVFRSMIDKSEEEVLMLETPLQKGDKVRVMSGSLIGLEGELIRIDGETKIVVRLTESFAAAVSMSADMVEKITDKD